MTTPRELVSPFLRALRHREDQLDELMATRNTTPEHHGELSACLYVRTELGIRLRLQDAQKIDGHWEQAFLAHLRRDWHPMNRSQQAASLYEQTFADELERIWIDAGIL